MCHASTLVKRVMCFWFQEAVDKYDTVVANLDFARELQKQFQSMSDEVCKRLKLFCSTCLHADTSLLILIVKEKDKGFVMTQMSED